MSKISIEKMYQNYLRLNKLSEDEMSEGQRIGMKQSFFAGTGSLLKMLESSEDMPDNEKEAINLLESLRVEISDFFQKAMLTYLKKNGTEKN